jgi:thiamine biosynthesis lipoprotein ApbE
MIPMLLRAPAAGERHPLAAVDLGQQAPAEPWVDGPDRLHVEDLMAVRPEEQAAVQLRLEMVERAIVTSGNARTNRIHDREHQHIALHSK